MSYGYEWVSGLAVDSLNNIYLAGSTQSFGEGDNDIFLLKYFSSSQINVNSSIEVNSDKNTKIRGNYGIAYSNTTLILVFLGIAVIISSSLIWELITKKRPKKLK